MAQKPLDTQQMQEAIDAFARLNSKEAAAKLLGIKSSTYTSRLRAARNAGIQPSLVVEEKKDDVMTQLQDARDKIQTLEATIATEAREKVDADFIKRTILKLKDTPVNPPKWLIRKEKKKSFAGVPTLFASDWHWGEIVDPNQINHVNKFDISIAHDRARVMIEKTIDLLKNHVAHTDYPGIVFVLGRRYGFW